MKTKNAKGKTDIGALHMPIDEFEKTMRRALQTTTDETAPKKRKRAPKRKPADK